MSGEFRSIGTRTSQVSATTMSEEGSATCSRATAAASRRGIGAAAEGLLLLLLSLLPPPPFRRRSRPSRWTLLADASVASPKKPSKTMKLQVVKNISTRGPLRRIWSASSMLMKTKMAPRYQKRCRGFPLRGVARGRRRRGEEEGERKRKRKRSKKRLRKRSRSRLPSACRREKRSKGRAFLFYFSALAFSPNQRTCNAICCRIVAELKESAIWEE